MPRRLSQSGMPGSNSSSICFEIFKFFLTVTWNVKVTHHIPGVGCNPKSYWFDSGDELQMLGLWRTFFHQEQDEWGWNETHGENDSNRSHDVHANFDVQQILQLLVSVIHRVIGHLDSVFHPINIRRHWRTQNHVVHGIQVRHGCHPASVVEPNLKHPNEWHASFIVNWTTYSNIICQVGADIRRLAVHSKFKSAVPEIPLVNWMIQFFEWIIVLPRTVIGA